MGGWLGVYGLTALAFVAIDAVWLGWVAPQFYQKHLGHFLRPDPLWIPAVLFYGVYIAGVVVFAVRPGLESGSVLQAAALGGMLGLMAYATFDLTSMALFKDFPTIVVVVDLIWGTVLTATVAASGVGLGRWVGVGG